MCRCLEAHLRKQGRLRPAWRRSRLSHVYARATGVGSRMRGCRHLPAAAHMHMGVGMLPSSM